MLAISTLSVWSEAAVCLCIVLLQFFPAESRIQDAMYYLNLVMLALEVRLDAADAAIGLLHIQSCPHL